MQRRKNKNEERFSLPFLFPVSIYILGLVFVAFIFFFIGRNSVNMASEDNLKNNVNTVAEDEIRDNETIKDVTLDEVANKTSETTEAEQTMGTEQATEAEQTTETEQYTEKSTDNPVQKETEEMTSEETQDNETTQAVTGNTPVEIHGQLYVDGVVIKDQNGENFQLKGVSTHGIDWFPQYVNFDAFASFLSYGANAVRLAMYSEEGNGYAVADDNKKQYLEDLIYKGVTAATDLGMYVIIDWHVLGDQNPNKHVDQAEAFFKKMSEKYKDHNNVIYEICNEPNGGTGWQDIKTYAERIIPVIRANSKDALIIVGTPTWSQDIDQAANNPITGYDNILYALHFYADTHKDWLRQRLTDARNKGLAVIVSEFGICDASGNGANNYNEGNAWIDLLNDYDIGYFIWSLCNKAETSALISSGSSKTGGFTDADLSDSGRWIKEVLGKDNDGYYVPANPNPVSPNNPPEGNSTQDTKPAQSSVVNTFGDFDVEIVVKESWNGGQNTVLSIKNNSASNKEGWRIKLTFATAVTSSSNWNSEVSAEGNSLIITPANYNTTIYAGNSIMDIGLILSGSDFTITSVEFN